jgi:hypothetical protein
MKKYILIAFFFTVSSHLSAQEYFLKKDRPDIHNIMQSVKYDFMFSDKTSDKVYLFDVFKSDVSKMLFYYNESNICVMMMKVYDMKYLKLAIEQLNKEYIIYENGKWMAKDFKTSIQLNIKDREFSVKYESI